MDKKLEDISKLDIKGLVAAHHYAHVVFTLLKEGVVEDTTFSTSEDIVDYHTKVVEAMEKKGVFHIFQDSGLDNPETYKLPSSVEVKSVSFFVSTQEELVKGSLDTPHVCHYCEKPAVVGYVWADGRAFIPVCQEHREKAKHQIEVVNKDKITFVANLSEKDVKDQKESKKVSLSNFGAIKCFETVKECWDKWGKSLIKNEGVLVELSSTGQRVRLAGKSAERKEPAIIGLTNEDSISLFSYIIDELKKSSNFLLDSEIVIYNNDGQVFRGDCKSLDGKFAVAWVFDVLKLDGKLLDYLPYSERRKQLSAWMEKGDFKYLRLSPSFLAKTKFEFFGHTDKMFGVPWGDGVIFKRATQPYVWGEETSDWAKVSSFSDGVEGRGVSVDKKGVVKKVFQMLKDAVRKVYLAEPPNIKVAGSEGGEVGGGSIENTVGLIKTGDTGKYVIQLHDINTLHGDIRLEISSKPEFLAKYTFFIPSKVLGEGERYGVNALKEAAPKVVKYLLEGGHLAGDVTSHLSSKEWLNAGKPSVTTIAPGSPGASVNKEGHILTIDFGTYEAKSSFEEHHSAAYFLKGKMFRDKLLSVVGVKSSEMGLREAELLGTGDRVWLFSLAKPKEE